MLGKQKNPIFEKSTGTVIGEGIIIEGASLKGSGAIRIDGQFSGNLDIEGHIILGETGVIIGDIKAESAMFAGKYSGNMSIKSTLHLASTAKLEGHVETEKIIIDENAVFKGTCNTTSPNERTSVIKTMESASSTDTSAPLSLSENKPLTRAFPSRGI
jgi:cytoskeletal protein CcmA (bactofilin family)